MRPYRGHSVTAVKRRRRLPTRTKNHKAQQHLYLATTISQRCTLAACCVSVLATLVNSLHVVQLPRARPVRPRTARKLQREEADGTSENANQLPASLLAAPARRRATTAIVSGPNDPGITGSKKSQHVVQRQAGSAGGDAYKAAEGRRQPASMSRHRPRVVARHGFDGGERDIGNIGMTLIEKQKALCRQVKTLGQRRDWRGALTTLRCAEHQLSMHCWNAALSAMATSARWQEALALLKNIRREGISPDQHSYSAAMRACGAAGRPEDALALLDAMRDEPKGGVRPDAFCFNVCISAVEKAGLHEKALSLLREMRSEGVKPDVFSFNSVINALGMAGRWQDALGMMEEMVVEEGIAPNTVTYASAINACGKARQLDRALSLLEEGRMAGVEVGTSAYNAAITACGHAGSADDALPLLKEMRDRGVPRSVITYSSLINVCGKGGMSDVALDLFQQMKVEGIAPNEITYNAVIHASAGGGTGKPEDTTVVSPVSSADESSDSIENARGERGPRDIASGRAGLKRWDRVMPLLDEMQAAGHHPDLLSFNLALAACARRGEAARTLRLLGDMRKAGLLPASVSYGTTMRSSERAGDVDQTLSLLKGMKASGVRRTLVTFNTALLACAKEARRAAALELLSEMKQIGVAPNEKTFRLVIQACGRAGDAAGALVVLRGMSKAGVVPGEYAIASTMEAFAMKGEVDQVLALMEDARTSASRGRPYWSCIVVSARCCAAAGRAADAIGLLRELPPDSEEQDSGDFEAFRGPTGTYHIDDDDDDVVKFAIPDPRASDVRQRSQRGRTRDDAADRHPSLGTLAPSTMHQDASECDTRPSSLDRNVENDRNIDIIPPKPPRNFAHHHAPQAYIPHSTVEGHRSGLAEAPPVVVDKAQIYGEDSPLLSASASSALLAEDGGLQDGNDDSSTGDDGCWESKANSTVPLALSPFVTHDSMVGVTETKTGRREGAWRGALWAAARAGQATATVELMAAIREAGFKVSAAHYNAALRMLAGSRDD